MNSYAPKFLTPLTLSLALVNGAARSQQAAVFRDLNVNSQPFSSSPRGEAVDDNSYVQLGAEWFFVAEGAGSGRELWKTDGTSQGTVLVLDIRAGAESSSPSMLSGGTDAMGRPVLWFLADDGVHGRELWKSDGTGSGTALTVDHTVGAGSTDFRDIEGAAGGHVYFMLPGQLYCSDGSSFWPIGNLAGYPRAPREMCALGNSLVFSADGTGLDRELWITDGLTWQQVENIHSAGSSDPTEMRAFAGKIYFVADDGMHGREMWSTDGTQFGTGMVQDIHPGSNNSDPLLQDSGAAGSFLYFSAADDVAGRELWRTDGTGSGTTLFADVERGARGSGPRRIRATASGQVFFAAQTAGNRTRDLWVSDGTAVGTRMLTIAGMNPLDPSSIVAIGPGSVAFWSLQGSRLARTFALCTSDGTITGSLGSDFGATLDLTPTANGEFLVGGAFGSPDRELHAGTLTGLRRLADINPRSGTQSSRVEHVTSVFDQWLIMSADTGAGNEPHVLRNGTVTQLADIFPGVGRGGFNSSVSTSYTPYWNGTETLVFFAAHHPQLGPELWVTDGTIPGTRRLTDHSATGELRSFNVTNGRLYFDFDGALWTSDGTVVGTHAVSSAVTIVRGLTAVGDQLFFAGRDATAGEELWVSDGSAAGTRQVIELWPGVGFLEATIVPGTAGYDVSGVPVLYFEANTRGQGLELWKSDGSVAGTSIVKDIYPGTGHGFARQMVWAHGKLWFSANDGVHGRELWSSDGTDPGTDMVADVNQAGDGSPSSITVTHNGMVFFRAYSHLLGDELFASDGTALGTGPVVDLAPGLAGSAPTDLTVVGNRIYFTVINPATGRDLWVSDGRTAAGTHRVQGVPTGAIGEESIFTVFHGELLFAATTPQLGRELYVVAEPGASVASHDVVTSQTSRRLTSSAPVLGSTLTLSAESTGGYSFGALFLSRSVAPYALPIAGDGTGLVSLNGGVTLLISTRPQFDLSFTLPSSPSLLSMTTGVQAFWFDLPNALVETSNSVLLGFGIE